MICLEHQKTEVGHAQAVFSRSPWSFEVPDTLRTHTYVEYERAPINRFPIVLYAEEHAIPITIPMVLLG